MSKPIYKLLENGKVLRDPKTKEIKFPLNALLMNRITRKKKRVYLHNQEELNQWLTKTK